MNRFWTSEKLLSLTALLVSVMTFVVFLYQTNLMRKQQYMSVFPYLEFANSGTNTDHYTYVLRNNGIGPAVIKSVKVTYKDTVFNDVVYYVRSQITAKDSLSFYYANVSPGRLLPEKERVKMIENYDLKVSSSKKLYEILNRDSLEVEIVYESIYGEGWILNSKSDFPIRQ